MGYIDLIKEKEKEKKLLKEKALKEAEKLSKLLRKEFKYDSLFLIGSIIKDRGFTRQSDIDFVIKGLKKEAFFKAHSFLTSNSNFDIDLKPYEELDKDSQLRISREGRLLN